MLNFVVDYFHQRAILLTVMNAQLLEQEIHNQIIENNPNASIYETPEGELLYCDTGRSFYDNDGDVRDVVVSGNDGTETWRHVGWAAEWGHKRVAAYRNGAREVE